MRARNLQRFVFGDFKFIDQFVTFDGIKVAF